MFDMPVKKGTKVLIKKGTALRSTHPTRKNFVAKKDYIITTFNSDPEWKTEEGTVYPAKVEWAGTGGYWTWANLADVVVLKDNLTLVEETAKLRRLV